MLKSMSKRGFTLVEVLCSLGVFSIIFICMMSYEVTSLNMKRSIKSMNDNVLIMEAVKNNIIYSMTYEELVELKKDNRIFINKENMTLNKIQGTVKNVFSRQAYVENPYIELSFLKCEFKVYSLRLSLHEENENHNIELQCNFYKGCY